MPILSFSALFSALLRAANRHISEIFDPKMCVAKHPKNKSIEKVILGKKLTCFFSLLFRRSPCPPRTEAKSSILVSPQSMNKMALKGALSVSKPGGRGKPNFFRPQKCIYLVLLQSWTIIFASDKNFCS